jgi:hypothetical protein
MMGSDTSRRGAVQLVDAVMTMIVLVALVALAPYFARFLGMASSAADPFSSLLFQLILPMLFLALIVSVGVSARGGA